MYNVTFCWHILSTLGSDKVHLKCTFFVKLKKYISSPIKNIIYYLLQLDINFSVFLSEMLLSLNIKVKCELVTTRYIVEIMLRYFIEMCW